VKLLFNLRVASRNIALRVLVQILRLFSHRIFTSLLLLFSIFVLSRFYFASTAFSDIIASFLLVEYFFGTIYYVSQVIKKIEHSKSKPDLRRIMVSKCELAKKDVDRYLTMFAAISGVGLAAMILTPSQSRLAGPLLTMSGIFVEIVTTILFALLYWWLFFLLMERYPTGKAATLAGFAYLLPTIVGAFATVEIAVYFGLNFLQDSIAAFLPFLIVYYLFDRSTPDFKLSPYLSLEIESAKEKKRIKEIQEDLQSEILEARKALLEIQLSELQIRERMLEEATRWFRLGYERIEVLQRDFAGFQEEVESERKTYEDKVKGQEKGRINLLVADRLFFAQRISSSDFRIFENGQDKANYHDKKIAKTITGILSLHEVSCVSKPRRRESNIDFNMIHRKHSMIAIEETNTEDMPEPCREFDRMTLIEYFPAETLFKINKEKYETLFCELSKCPCLNFAEKFEEAENNLLLSIEEFSKRVRERIDAALILQSDYPECYMVKAFTAFHGVFGVAACQDLLRSLDTYKTRIDGRKMEIARLRNVIKLEHILPPRSKFQTSNQKEDSKWSLEKRE